MIEGIYINNHLSYYSEESDETIVSMAPLKSISKNMDHIIDKCLPLCIIYGANDSGKTNLLKCIECIKNIILGKDVMDLYNPYDTSKPTEFEIKFSIDNKIWYRYNVIFKNNYITKEILTYDDMGNLDTIFCYSDGKIESRYDITSQGYVSHSLIYDLSSKIDIFKDIVDWFDNYVDIFIGDYSSCGSDAWISTYVNISNKVKDMLKPIDIFRDFDFSYESIQNITSLGKKRILSFSYNLIKLQLNGGLLVIDNFDMLIHPSIMRYLISYFIKNNKNNGQLIYTSNDYSMLNYSRIRYDEIYFCKKVIDLPTELYSLCEYKNLDRFDNIMNGYFIGRFDGIHLICEFNYI